MPTPDLTYWSQKLCYIGTFPRAYPGLTVHQLPFANTTMLSSTFFQPVAEEKRSGVRGCACRTPDLGKQRGHLTRFIRTLRRSKEFLTKGGFLDRVELSLSLRFSCKEKRRGTLMKARAHSKGSLGPGGWWGPQPSPSCPCSPRGLRAGGRFHSTFFFSLGEHSLSVYSTMHAPAC